MLELLKFDAVSRIRMVFLVLTNTPLFVLPYSAEAVPVGSLSTLPVQTQVQHFYYHKVYIQNHDLLGLGRGSANGT